MPAARTCGPKHLVPQPLVVMAKKSTPKTPVKPPAKSPTKPLPRVRIRMSLATTVALVAVIVSGLHIAWGDKVAPGTLLNDTLVAFEDAETVQQNYSRTLDAYEQTPIQVTYENQTALFSLIDLGVTLDKTASVNAIPTGFSLTGNKEVRPHFTLNNDTLIAALLRTFPEAEHPARDARLEWNRAENRLDILPEEAGWLLDRDALTIPLEASLNRLEPLAITLFTVPDLPRIIEADLELERTELEEKLRTMLTLTAEGETWEWRWSDFLDALVFAPERVVQADNMAIPVEIAPQDASTQTRLNIRLNPETEDPLAFINEQLAPNLEIAPQDVTVTQAEDGTVIFDGTAVDGIEINRPKLLELLEIALNRTITAIEIPLIKTPGRVYADERLKERGITELVAVGYSGYFGSPYNRQHNIRTAIRQFDGVIVEPGEVFSFGDVLGVVDGSTGYAKELVIKEGETIPEYGGGVCQVSSTLFRAILFSGLPIVERHPHSYAVSYYAYPLGYGLDATVYPPQVDLKFLNDMKTSILIQAYVEGQEAYFKFYGTKDGRKVAMDGPFISNRRPPPDPEFIESPDLLPGQKKKVDSAHSGFTAEWTRTVTYPADVAPPSTAGAGASKVADGVASTAAPSLPRITTDRIISPYKPWAEKWQVGAPAEN